MNQKQYTLQVRVDDNTGPWVKTKLLVLANDLVRNGYKPVVYSDDFFVGHQNIFGGVKLQDTEFMGETG